MLKRSKLLVEFGPYSGGGTSGSQPTGVSGFIPNVATARIGINGFNVDPKKEMDRRKAEQRRRIRLKELVREWFIPATGRKTVAPQPVSGQQS